MTFLGSVQQNQHNPNPQNTNNPADTPGTYVQQVHLAFEATDFQLKPERLQRASDIPRPLLDRVGSLSLPRSKSSKALCLPRNGGFDTQDAVVNGLTGLQK